MQLMLIRSKRHKTTISKYKYVKPSSWVCWRFKNLGRVANAKLMLIHWKHKTTIFVVLHSIPNCQRECVGGSAGLLVVLQPPKSMPVGSKRLKIIFADSRRIPTYTHIKPPNREMSAGLKFETLLIKKKLAQI